MCDAGVKRMSVLAIVVCVLADGGESDDACLFLCIIYGQDHHDKGQREGRGGGVEECVVARFALCVFVRFVRDEGHTQKSRRRAGGGAEAWQDGGLLLPVRTAARRTVERDRLLRSMLKVAVLCVRV